MATHPLLVRQLRRLGLSAAQAPDGEGWQALLAVLQRTYEEADQDRGMLEHSLDISSEEMAEMYQRQKSAFESRLRHLAGIIEHSPVVAVTWRNEPGWPVDFVSGNIVRFGHDPEDFMSGRLSFMALVHDEDRAGLERDFAGHVRNGPDDYRHEYRFRHGDGRWIWVEVRMWLTRSPDGEVAATHGVLIDVSERKCAERALRESEQHFRTLANGGAALIWTSGVDKLCTYFNEPWLRFTGRSLEQELGNGWTEGIHPEDFERAMQIYGESFDRRESFSMEYRLHHADGSYHWIQDVGNPRFDTAGAFIGYIGFCYDISAQKEQQRQLEHVAHFDVLTGLPNRILLADRLRQGMYQARRHGRQLAVAYIDLDGFKAVNDSHGHAVGDRLLMELASRMRQCLREGDTIARLGGDEFVTILVDLPDTETCIPLVKRLLAATAQPVVVDGMPIRVSSSIGIAYYAAGDDSDAEQLVRHADQAMYQAKQSGKSRFMVFDAAHDRAVRDRHQNIRRIRRALAENRFVLHYQPKVNLRTGELVGAEALIRWQDPDRGLLMPGTFLPEIGDHPLGIRLGEWVIDTALAQIEVWLAQGIDLPVSVNIAAHHLQRPDFVGRLRTLLGGHPNVPIDRLSLEVLETSALEEVGHMPALFAACADLGVSFALDDFGTGYSSLTYLKRLPVRVLKIDQSFVRDMLSDPDDLAIIAGVLGLARSFGREVVAEGVETVAHGEALLRLGCEVAQGYGIARPMPATDLPAWRAQWHPDPRWAMALAPDPATLASG
ncbi:MAG: EAL domain-containing protein [Betaproteobacteria bacterium]|nr:EAL domain-containing protein [Betaproteobacteria bacterium]